jgi:hypothetical protein
MRYTVLKNGLQAVQKGLRCEAREKSTSGGVLYAVRWSEALERNEAGEPFSTA